LGYHGLDLCSKNFQREIAPAQAATWGHTIIVDLLHMSSNLDTGFKSNGGNTPLVLSTEEGNQVEIKGHIKQEKIQAD
jgi:hypothetical protein